VVFGTSPGTPDVGTWVLSITALNTGTQDATVAISDDLGGRQSTSFSYTDHSPLIVLPDNKGSITFYGSNFALNDTWTIIRQSPMPSWAGEIYARVPDIEASALALMSPRLAAIYRGAPLGLDKLAAVVAALGGAV
jgi:hypothetical protein